MVEQYDDAFYAELERKVREARRLEARDKAKDDMLTFMKLTMPDPQDVEDVRLSRFEETPLARLLCQIIERIDRLQEKRVCVSVGPQFGKSQVLSRGAPAWLSGRNPYRNIMLGAYNDTFAQEFGGDVRDIIQSAEFKSIFPDYALRKGSEAKDMLITTKNAKLSFVGVGGSGTGKPADTFIVEDPYRNPQDAESAMYRKRVWEWFTGVTFARLHKDSAIVVVHTRWHEDDLIGRLVDPDHPERNTTYRGVAEGWTYYNLPAIVQDSALAAALGLTLEEPTNLKIIEQFGCKPMVSLWEGRKSIEFLAEAKRLDKRTFNALYMGCPAPEEGSYFKAENIVEYHSTDDLPKYLRNYGASDHAVSEAQNADSTVIGCVGVAEDDDIWVLPDLVMDRMETDIVVDNLLLNMQTNKPQIWWLESELISKSFGPFLKKRMHEEKVYVTLDPKTPSRDKKTRARAIQGRMQQRRVHFPAFAPWWNGATGAKAQLLKFPYGTHDDFVDWLSWIGLGLTAEYGASVPKQQDNVIKSGTLAWIKAAHNQEERQRRARKAVAGW